MVALALPKAFDHSTQPDPHVIRKVGICRTGARYFLREIFTSRKAFPCTGAGNLPLVAVSNAGRTRATSHPCERGAGLLQKLAGSGVAKSRRIRSHQFPWRCVMSLDPKSVARQNLGSLQGCLVEGDPEQRARE